MIVVDTSAIMAVLLGETGADACAHALEAHDQLVMSAGTLAELLIVAERRGLGPEAARLIDGLGIEIVPVTPAAARGVAAAYGRWGKGVHSAALNFGDCFAYEAAQYRDLPLLFIGQDFAQTDIGDALGSVGQTQ